MRHLITFRQLTIANDLLPAIAYGDYSGLEDDDIDQLNSFLTDLESEIATFCESLTPDRSFHDLIIGDRREDYTRECDVTKFRSFCSPVTVMVTTYGGTAPDADLYEYKIFDN